MLRVFKRAKEPNPNSVPLKVPWIILFLMLTSSFLFAQKVLPAVNVSMTSPSNYAFMESHRELEKSYYLVENAESLSQLDMATLVEQQVYKVVRNYYVSEDRLVTKIHYDKMENFGVGTQPALMVIDTGGMVMFDAAGNQMVSHRILKEEHLRNFDLDNLYSSNVQPSNEEIELLAKEGAVVTNLGEGKLEIDFDGDKVVFSNDKIFSEMSFYTEEGDLEGKQKTLYVKLPTGESVMARKKSTRYVTLPSGACAEFVQETIFSDYRFTDRRVESRSKRIEPATNVERFLISPNPIEDFINIDYAQTFDDSDKLNFAIYSLEGSLIRQSNELNTGSLEIPVDKLKAGVYFIKVKDDSGNLIIKKFVKL